MRTRWIHIQIINVRWEVFRVSSAFIVLRIINVSYIFNCMSHYVDFNACFFRGDFSANEYSSDISNWFE